MESLDNCTDACLQASSVQPTLNPSLSFWVHCTDTIIFPIVGSFGALCWLSLLWTHCTGVCNLPHVGLTGECKLPLSWSFRPDFFGVLYLFIPWTYKPDNDHLNTYISPSVVCVINHQNIILKYGMRGHFLYKEKMERWSGQRNFLGKELKLALNELNDEKVWKKNFSAWFNVVNFCTTWKL